MIIILKSGATDEQVDHVIRRVESLGLKAHLSRGTFRTIIGVIGDESQYQPEQFQVLPGVVDVIRVLPPYKLASVEAHPQPSVVDVAGVRIGGGNLAMIAGPCAVESAERMDAIAGAVRKAGANILRGGAFKPRTSPYAYQGMGEDGLKILRETGDKHGLPVVTEVMDPRKVELVERYADMIQIGARNMQNFSLLTEVGNTKKPVLLKRGMSATIVDLLMSAEYILSRGNPNVVLCERGVKGFDNITRNMFDVAAVPACKSLSHLPIIVDPSHATGRPDLIPPCALAGVAAGADGVHIEVHDCPEEALSDGPQALLPDQYALVAEQIRKLAELLGKKIASKAGSN
ncbi:MAG: 3-deoxy-7-phosphoheptulonate synthase [Pirellulales bacterium]